MKSPEFSSPSAKAAFLALAGSVLLLAQPASATVVTSNNLSSTALPSLQTDNSIGSFLVETDPYKLYRLQGIIASTKTGSDISGYQIMGLSKGSLPAVNADLFERVTARTYGQAFPATLRGLNIVTGSESASYYYTLGLGTDVSSFNSRGYNWSATDMRLYSATGVQGNIVPNASFEDTSVNFWKTSTNSAGGSFVSDPGVHGSTVWKIDSTATGYLTLAVQPGVEYEYSFWSASPDIGSGHKIEYGFYVPAGGSSATPGNSSIWLAKGNGSPKPWTEYTGTFTPGEGQTLWYLGGMANQGYLYFDSIYVAQVAAIPEPGMAALLLVGGGVLWLRRRSRSKA